MNDDKNSLPKTLKEYMEQRLTLKAIDPSELDNTANYYDKILALRLVILGQNFSEHFKFYIQDKITDKIISKIILDYYEKQGYKIKEIMSLFFQRTKKSRTYIYYCLHFWKRAYNQRYRRKIITFFLFTPSWS